MWRRIRSFSRRWLASREWRRLWAMIPVVVFGLAVLAVAILLRAWSPQSNYVRYKLVVEQAMGRGDWNSARIGLERLLTFFSAAEATAAAEHKFQLAQVLEKLAEKGGEEAIPRQKEAAALISEIAPLGQPGYGPAHLLQARRLLSTPQPKPEMVRDAERHLLRAASIPETSVEADEMLGRIYLDIQRNEDAEKRLRRVADKRPEAALLLAEALARTNRGPEATEVARKVAGQFSAMLKSHDGDPVLRRIQWAKALLLQRDFTAAVKVLDDGIKERSATAFNQAIGDVTAAWIDDDYRRRPNDWGERLLTLQRGLAYAPNHELLLRMLIQVSKLKDEAGKTARGTLEKLIVEGGQNAVLHLTLGLNEIEDGRPEDARKHFEISYQLDRDTSPVIANNLAMVLVLPQQKSPEELRKDALRALEIIDPVVQKFPNVGVFRDTRGHVLCRLGRHAEAIPDLEAALPVLTGLGKKATHEMLAQAYEKAGNAEFAQKHREEAAKAGSP